MCTLIKYEANSKWRKFKIMVRCDSKLIHKLNGIHFKPRTANIATVARTKEE